MLRCATVGSDGAAPSPQAFRAPGTRRQASVFWGVGLTLGVRFNGSTREQNTIEISSAGIDFLT
jgi:hypothetical protein